MHKFKNVNISDTCLDLAQLMAENPSKVERPLIQAGETHLAFFEDPNYTNQFMNMRELKKEILLMAAEDVARGVQLLQTSNLGVTFHLNKLKTYVVPHGNSPEGSVVYSVSWKNQRAFLNWRKGSTVEVPQEVIDQCLYLLAFRLSELL